MTGTEPPEGMQELYPFLYSGESEIETVLEEVSRSTEEKAEEIVRLRREVAERSGVLLAECAEAMAKRFAMGGRLFTFGNGGSSTDAEEVAAAFSYPPRGRPLP